MHGITKHFGGVHALEGVSFEAYSGEVHALCGENGAGKSTLMKILAGAITEFDGSITLEGQPVRFGGPRAAEEAGVRIIYQELNLVPDLTVAGNIFLGRELRNALGLIDNRAMEEAARRLFTRLGTPIDPRARVGGLRIGDQQMVEIAKALAFEASILIMDEPTSALSDAEVARLFRVIADLKAAGTSIIYISHKMNEVFRLADRVTVLRDGRFVATARRDETQPAQVVRWMVGREIATLRLDRNPSKGPAVLTVSDLALPRPAGTSRPALTNIAFELAGGEILGVAGLLGSGRTELLEALFGASPLPPQGEIRLRNHPVRFRSPLDAIRAGVALVTEDRKNLGLFSEMNVRENISLVSLREMTSLGSFVSRARENAAVREEIDRLAIKTAGSRALISKSALSAAGC
jgi:ABC-type sugar transport system ATPase subunit